MQPQQLHHEIATDGDSKICTGAQTLNRRQQRRPGGPGDAVLCLQRLNETSHLGHFFINFELHTGVFHIAWGGTEEWWGIGISPIAVGNWEGEENTGWQLKEEMEDESSEVVFTCLGNVGQSPTEDL